MSATSATNSSVLSPPPSTNDSPSVAAPLAVIPITAHQHLPIGEHQSKHLGADYASEPKTEMCINHHRFKSCARKRQTRYLPEEILFNILSYLPAQVLLDVMRHVCKEWNLIIRSQNFIRRHLRNSTSGILIQMLCSDGNGIYVEMQRGCLEVHKFDCGFGDVVWTSCNGLVLAVDCKDNHILYVVNPLTKRRATLPPYIHQIFRHADFCLAFVEASMEYKVVHARDSKFALKPQIAVLTIGVDKVWRYIDIDIELFSLITDEILTSSPLVTGAYVHWIGRTYVLKLNVETETISLFRVARSWNECGIFLPMGSNLSYIYVVSKFLRDVWEMNPETGKWIKLLRFDLRPVSIKIKELFPIYSHSTVPYGWLKVREVLLFSRLGGQGCCIAYNLKTKEMHKFKLDTKMNNFQAHVNSLVWLEGAF